MKHRFTRALALLLTLALFCAVLPRVSLPAAADGDVLINEENFPDENFRAYVRDNFDSDGNGVLSQAELENVTQIYCSYCSISSLKGIEYFTALEVLRCYDNHLTALDVSKNTALEDLFCYSNQLTALDVSKNTALRSLYCGDNQLTALDVSKNTALEDLFCYSNQLTSLDVSKNTALEQLWCDNNQLTALDVSKNTALENLSCYSNQLTALDVSKNTALWRLSCGDNQLTALDVSKNSVLKDLSCDRNQLTALDVSKNTAMRYLGCSYNQLTALDMSKNIALDELYCYDNHLTELDVSKNTALKYLGCGNNQLTELDVSKNTALMDLSCGNNQLTELDVSKNTALASLSCEYNQLTELDLSKNPELEQVLLQGERDSTTVGFLLYELDSETNGYQFVSFDYATSVLLSDGSVFQGKPFSDVKPRDYFYNAVIWAIRHKPQITSGTGEGKFSPKKTCTREQIVTFLYAAAGKPEYSMTENPFSDVKKSRYYYDAVMWAAESGITSGSGNGRFGVGEACIRAQAMTFLWIAAGRPEHTLTESPFSDVKPGKYFYNAVLWAYENGVTSGVGDGKFGVNDPCTRGQIVTFLYKAFGE